MQPHYVDVAPKHPRPHTLSNAQQRVTGYARLGLLFHCVCVWLCVCVYVCTVPIAIEIVCTTTLALGSRQLSAHGAIVTRLAAIEEMAGMNMLCSDKTGTRTASSAVPLWSSLGYDNLLLCCRHTHGRCNDGICLRQGRPAVSNVYLLYACVVDTSRVMT